MKSEFVSRELTGYRAALFGLSEGDPVTGWVIDLSSRHVVLRLPASLVLEPGREVEVRIQARGRLVTFRAAYIGPDGALGDAALGQLLRKVALSAADRGNDFDCVFAVASFAVHQGSQESFQVLMPHLTSELLVDGMDFDGALVAAGDAEATFIIDWPMELNGTIHAKVQTSQGPVHLKGEIVRHEQHGSEPGRTVLHVRAHPGNRIDAARWNRFLNGAAA